MTTGLALDRPHGYGVKDDQTDVDGYEHHHGQVRDHLSRTPLVNVAAVLDSGKCLREKKGQGNNAQVLGEINMREARRIGGSVVTTKDGDICSPSKLVWIHIRVQVSK